MALIGTFEVEGQVKNKISQVRWGIGQEAFKGKAHGETHHSEIKFTIKNVDDSLFFYDWANSQEQKYNATISFNYNTDNSGVVNTLKINNAICTGFSFILEENSQEEVTLMVHLSPESIEYIKGA